MTDTVSSTTVVAIVNGTYATLKPLPGATADTERLVRLLADKHGYGYTLIADERRGTAQTKIESALPAKGLSGGTLIVLWIGHGKRGADGSLRLLCRDTDTADAEVMNAARLGELAAETGAKQVLVVLDTCYSGSGLPDAFVIAQAVLNGRADLTAVWFGVLAASRDYQTSLSGVLVGELDRLLRTGPRTDELLLEWDPRKPQLTGEDLIDAVLKEWTETLHKPQGARTGDSRWMLRNPLHREQAPSQVVEHLLQAARGTSTEANYFTGRERQLELIVGWLSDATPGLCVVTGPAGSGKSGILGRIVSLSIPSERTRIGEIPAPALDPGESSIDAHLHVRGLAWTAVVQTVNAQLQIEVGGTIHDLLAAAGRAHHKGTPLVIVIDGLDEAAESRDIAVQIIEPLARVALVIVGTRELGAGSGELGLVAMMGTSAVTIDLGTDIAATLRDIEHYALRRLTAVADVMDPQTVADEIVRIARAGDPGTEGSFLLARLITSQLRDVEVDTSSPNWRGQLASSVESALEADLQRTVLTIDGREHPTAARELLRALSCAHGRGLPPDDLWPAAATAISATGTTYGRADVYALLMTLGRHVVADAEGSQQVYRIAHQRLVDYLRPTAGSPIDNRLSPTVALPIAETFMARYRTWLDQGEPAADHVYLWRYLWRHCADAGADGITALRVLVDSEGATFRLDLALALSLAGSRAWLMNSPDEATGMLAESVELRRQLDDPLQLATALFELSFAAAGAGEGTLADEAASEASDIARNAAIEPGGQAVLARALLARAVTQIDAGNATAARGIALESIALMESVLESDPDQAAALGSACTVGALACLNSGALVQAEELSHRAVEILDELLGTDGDDDVVLLTALTIRALIEFVALLQQVEPNQIADSRPDAAARVVEHFRRIGKTGTVSDIVAAAGLRLSAVTTWVKRMQTSAAPDFSDLLALLDEAATLVEPLAAGSGEAASVSALIHLARGQIGTGEPVDVHLAAAEAQLTAIARPTPVVRKQLGEIIHLRVGMALRQQPTPDGLVERQQQAVVLLSAEGEYVNSHLLYCQAIEQLILLLTVTGQLDAMVPAREELVTARRHALDGGWESALALATALTNLAFSYGETRPIEAIEASREGLRLLDGVEPARPDIRITRGLLNLNLIPPYTSLSEPAAALTAINAAIEALDQPASAPAGIDPAGIDPAGIDPAGIDPAVGNPTVAAALGIALANRAQAMLVAEHFERTVSDALRAITLLSMDGSTADPKMLPVTYLALGRALIAQGSTGDGTSALDTGIALLRAEFTRTGRTEQLAGGLNLAGDAAWNAVLAEFADDTAVVQRLSVQLNRPNTEIELTVRQLQRSIEDFSGDPLWSQMTRNIARVQRGKGPLIFDETWDRVVGPVPDWLRIEISLVHQLVAWWNTPTLETSRDYLSAHPELWNPATDIVIAEIRDAGEDDQNANFHLRVRARAELVGVPAAYAPYLARALIQRWLASDDEEAFLADHEDELHGPDVAVVLDQMAAEEEADEEVVDEAAGNDAPEPVDQTARVARVARAVLTLSRGGERTVAFRILEEDGFGVSLLRDAWRSDNIARLEALSVLAMRDESLTDAQTRFIALATALSYALRGETDGAVGICAVVGAGIESEQERVELLGAISDALARHTDRRAELFALLEAIGSKS